MSSRDTISHSKSQNDCIIKYGERLLPQVLDDWALDDPEYIVGIMVKSKANSGTNITPVEFINLSVSQLANAVNFTSHWLDDTLDPRLADTPETIALIGVQDFRYWAMYYACIKTGRQLLLPSPRNALPNTTTFINATDCKKLFYTGALVSQAGELKNLVPGLQIFPLPSLDEMTSSKATYYPYTKTWAEGKDDVAMIVHTSGSTGNPKPIYYTNTLLRRNDNDILTPPVEGRELANVTLCKPGTKCLIGSAFFHLTGIMASLAAVFNRFTVVCGPADQLASGKIAASVLKNIEVNGMMIVPSLCDAIFTDHGEELIPHFRALEHVCWLGGPLAHSTGEWIIANLPQTKLWQIFGSTEANRLPMLISPRSHWQYMEFHPLIGPSFDPTADPDVFEVVYHRHPDPKFAWARPTFDLFPDMQEFRSRDLLRRCRDPGFETLWKFEGRVDDMMVLSNGFKVNPVDTETKLQEVSALRGTLMFGVGHTACGLLLEPKNEGMDREELLDLIWPAIEVANALIPEHARVVREKVVVATPDRPFIRAAKGTVVRKLTLALYEKEIQQVYE